MRLFNTLLVLAALSSVAGCSASVSPARTRDTAVRAEPRRVSATTTDDLAAARAPLATRHAY